MLRRAVETYWSIAAPWPSRASYPDLRFKRILEQSEMAWEDKIKAVRDEIREGGKDGRRKS